ncbi:MAG: hypothetical protein K2X82_17885 [Gemmataceae bacterium]|nr:hypothetical protein [Gemmataceae bacterium]
MEKQLLVSIGRSKFTFSLELEDSAVALPSGFFTIPLVLSDKPRKCLGKRGETGLVRQDLRIGNDIRVSNVTAKDRLSARFLRPGIFSAAGFVTTIGLWRMFH